MASFNKQHAALSRKKILFVSAGIADPRAGWVIPFGVAARAGEDDHFLPKGMNRSAQNGAAVEPDQKSRYASEMMQRLNREPFRHLAPFPGSRIYFNAVVVVRVELPELDKKRAAAPTRRRMRRSDRVSEIG